MKRLAIIGGIGMMTMSGANMMWHGQQFGNNANTVAIASGAFICSIGISLKIQLCVHYVEVSAETAKIKRGPRLRSPFLVTGTFGYGAQFFLFLI